ncbi:MAG: carbonic anhydrase [Acidimicrobiia bacterium]|nr:carbonic anhydrase [Acidimicrobiia bacterium]
MKRIIEGLSKFQEEVFPQHEELFSELASGQRPEALLITCSDSRIDPALLTQTKPGDLFVIRNAGNIVPAFGQAIGGVTATIEYAVMALGVKDVIICGHSNCGAMKGVLHPEQVAKMKNVAAWLHYGEPARLIVEQKYSHLSGSELLMALTEQNVLAQLNNLRTHPAVAAGLAKGELRLHGWVYDIGTGDVTAFDASRDSFLPLRHVVSEVGVAR